MFISNNSFISVVSYSMHNYTRLHQAQEAVGIQRAQLPPRRVQHHPRHQQQWQERNCTQRGARARETEVGKSFQ